MLAPLQPVSGTLQSSVSSRDISRSTSSYRDLTRVSSTRRSMSAAGGQRRGMKRLSSSTSQLGPQKSKMASDDVAASAEDLSLDDGKGPQ
jgi:hypothetical protein